MFKKIAAAIARALASLGHGFVDLFGLGGLFGGGGPGIAPAFDQETTAADLLGQLRQRRSEHEQVAHRDAVETVDRYLRALPPARATADLSGLSAPVRAALLDMAPAELAALKSAGLNAIRKFVDRQDHGVHGVPNAVEAVVLPFTPKAPITPIEQLQWRIKQELLKDSDPYVAPKRIAR